jgi:hypothetical protein
MHRATVLLILFALALVAPVSSGAAPTPPAHSAALKKCKPGPNTKKCRCPQGQKLVKKGHKYRCRSSLIQGKQD